MTSDPVVKADSGEPTLPVCAPHPEGLCRECFTTGHAHDHDPTSPCPSMTAPSSPVESGVVTGPVEAGAAPPRPGGRLLTLGDLIVPGSPADRRAQQIKAQLETMFPPQPPPTGWKRVRQSVGDAVSNARTRLALTIAPWLEIR